MTAKESQRSIRPTLTGRLKPVAVPVYLGSGISRHLGVMLRPLVRNQAAVLIVDERVAAKSIGAIHAGLRKSGWRVHLSRVRGGETIKTAKAIDRWHEQWFAAGFDRHTPIIAVGGGTITDAVGYAAATYMRGIPLWSVPTTIVGQVDAAIGGKVGINHTRGKNLIGAYYHPKGILIDPGFLATLPDRERRSGLAEVVKYGIIADAKLFKRCERYSDEWGRGLRPLDPAVVKTCVALKLGVVAADEHDRGRRHILNFGHTLGHAFERWGGYRKLRHGEAVAIGMIAAAKIAGARGMIGTADLTRIESLSMPLIPPLRSFPSVAELLRALGTDKKRRAGQNLWVLPLRIGKVVICDDVSRGEVNAAVRDLAKLLGRRAQGS